MGSILGKEVGVLLVWREVENQKDGTVDWIFDVLEASMDKGQHTTCGACFYYLVICLF